MAFLQFFVWFLVSDMVRYYQLTGQPESIGQSDSPMSRVPEWIESHIRKGEGWKGAGTWADLRRRHEWVAARIY